MWKRIAIVSVLGGVAVAALMALGDARPPAHAQAQLPMSGTAAAAPRTNPFSDAWLAAYHGLFDNIWTAEYESRSQARPASGSLPSLIAPLQPDADIRMSNPSFNTEQNEFQIDINPTNSQYAIGTSNDSLAAGVGIYRTSDGGTSWTAFDAPIGVPACCDPGVAYAYDGSVYVSILRVSPYVTYVIRSTDNGVTWSTPTSVQTNDRPNIVVDNGAGSPRRGTVYMTYTDENAGNPGSNRVKGYKSTDNGSSWGPTFFVGDVISSTGFEQGSQPRVASDGTLYVGYQQYTDINAGCGAGVQNTLAKSTDGGVTWTYTVLPITQGGVCTPVQNGRGLFCYASNGAFRSRSSPIIGVNPTNPQHVYMLYSGGDLEIPYACDNLTGYHSDILFRTSTDGGATFSPPAKVNDDPPGKDQYYPWMSVTANGTIWAGWHDRREDPNDYRHRWYEAYSTDEGATWRKLDGSLGNEPIASVMSLPFNFIGDYAGLGAVGNTVLPMWWDSRVKSSGDPFTEVGPPVIFTPTPTIPPTVTRTATPANPTNTALSTSTSTSTDTPTPTNTSVPSTTTPVPPSATPTAPATATAAATSIATATSTATAVCGAGWTFVDGPHPNQQQSNILEKVVALSDDDVWAVGVSSSPPPLPVDTLIEHWNGSSWTVVPSPNPSNVENNLNDIKAASANDIWAVGYTGQGALILHWDGAQWSVVPNPPGFVASVALMGLDIISPTDMWVVGDDVVSAIRRTFIAHYNGSSWTVVPSPNMGAGENVLTNISAVSSTDVWATGFYMYDTDHYLDRTLTMHWDGVQWSIVPNADTGYNRGSNAIKAIASNDVWIVGVGQQNTNDEPASMIMHWNGAAWSMVPILNLGNGPNRLDDVTAVSSNDVWAVGMNTTLNPVHQETQVVHWDGTAWTVIPSPNPATDPHSDNFLYGVSAVSHTKAWAVGSYSYAATLGDATLHEHLSLMFADILPGSTFFSKITCLACRGIINGYPDGTFKPGNNVTRGQLSKIVSNSAGFSDIQTTQMFEDVPPGSTFFQYIGRLASRGFIGGYPCGAPPAGACVPPGNLPYFLPNANSTRGQISKIVSNAAGFHEMPSGQQFQDVPPSSAFYAYIYRLVLHQVMSGYACGTPPAGQCIPPGNLPYFRPSNNATRGQTSKIVANTFFPGCVTPNK